jgi:zinc transport system substrate-binding protein
MRYTISLLCASLAVTAPALAEVPRVMTDIPPVQSLAAQVMGDLGTPGVLLEVGANAHDFQLRPSQVSDLAEAGLVIWVGPEMTPWLDRTMDGLSDSGARLGLLAAEGTVTRAFGQAADKDHAHEGHDHAQEAETAHSVGEHDPAEAGHDHGAEDHPDAGAAHDHAHDGTDPHAWLDPGNAQVWLAAIAAELSRLDPQNAAVYAANAKAAADAVAAQDADIAARLKPVADRPFVVFHDAYGYFADHYGLTVAGAIALGDAASPGAAHLKALQAGLADGGALCIFPEANHDPKLVEVMAEGTGVKVGGALDPEGSSLEPGPGLYSGLLEGLAQTLIACLAKD